MGPASEPLMAMFEVIPAVMGTRVNQKMASLMPPRGARAATRNGTKWFRCQLLLLQREDDAHDEGDQER